jgi:adenine-specific DNA-methyltransferase
MDPPNAPIEKKRKKRFVVRARPVPEPTPPVPGCSADLAKPGCSADLAKPGCSADLAVVPVTGPESEYAFVLQMMLTCLGNKRTLVNHIRDVADEVCKRLKKPRLRILDGFGGSAVVSRKLSYVASSLHYNDMEEYAYLMGKCSVETPTAPQRAQIAAHIARMNELAASGPYVRGFVSELYAPRDTENIEAGERCFYTQENAQIIDTLRAYISSEVPEEVQIYCLVPLLYKASKHTNTSGVFKGFHKENGVGKWGGKKSTDVNRIKGPIQLDVPVWNTESVFVGRATRQDINTLIAEEFTDGSLDLVYLDPPYNQHPYGSNYFMLNLIASNVAPAPETLSRVSGIPNTWARSDYNYKKKAEDAMRELIAACLRKSAYVLISYNNEGIIDDATWSDLLEPYVTELFEIKYNAYRGSRNLAGRSNKVMERMYLVSQ